MKFARRTVPTAQEDESVPLVEAHLDEVATRLAARVPPHGSRPATAYAVWICACVTMEDAPTWLFYEDRGLVWCRIPRGSTATDLVDAEIVTGGHTSPGQVLTWLRGGSADPWTPFDDVADVRVLQDLTDKIRIP